MLPVGSVHSGHELQVKARMLQLCWDSCGKLMDFVAHFWPEKRGSLYWCASLSSKGSALASLRTGLKPGISARLDRGDDLTRGLLEATCPIVAGAMSRL